ncbi:serine hydrolase [Paenibacillus harenae]|uniref:serine hydrolase n=1 Tax=Paenibacillus harenae TaxID=306543 RepID=UPI00278F48E8|nr:serine hydrolase [Paenibacillus harenae]MDQ0062610.1 CubicO group peptidase (beta-lactamase class C family) [Paenibacillus harenae]
MNKISYMPGTALWIKSFAAALLIVCLMTTTVYGAASGAEGNGQSKELNAESAAAFLDAFFASEAAKPHYTGASVVVVKDGKVIAQKGYGVADKESGKAVDPASTVFRIASVSKTFTAVAAMQLIEQGKLNLTDDVLKVVPNLKLVNPFNIPVTIEHLLTHTTGFEIQDPNPEDFHFDFDKNVSIEDYVQANLPPVVRKPGSSYMYDNFASLLLGLAVEKASGVPFETYMKQNVFEPLGMKNSGFKLEGSLKEQLAAGYDAAGQKVETYALTPTVMPHGGMLSTAEDIGKFMIAFLSGGAGETSRVLAEKTVDQMEVYRSSIHPLMPDTTYGFEAPFQIPGAGSSSKIITKAGDLTDFSSYLFLIPEQNTGVFLTYNQQGVLRNLFYPQFIQTFFPQYAAPAQLAEYKPSSSDELSKFTGYYSDLRIKSFVSGLKTGEAGLTIADAFIGPRQLKQVDANLFVDGLTNQFTAFKLDENGNVLYMKEPYINPLGYASKGVTPAGFADVTGEHAYAEQILALQSLGYYSNDASVAFQPEQQVTRGEYVQFILESSNLKGSETTELAFSDLDGHPSASFIQTAYELGMVKGTGTGKFQPERVISRQEAAAILWRMYSLQYSPQLFENVKLAGKTDAWAIPAVQMMIALGIHGPEVQRNADGAADFGSKNILNKQELAAILFALLTQPTDQMVAALSQSAPGSANTALLPRAS